MPEFDDACIVYVGNLAFETTWQTLKDYFREAGDVRFADLIADRQGRSRGCGLVTFHKADDAENAIRLFNNTELEGRQILVRRYEGGPKPPLVGRGPYQRQGPAQGGRGGDRDRGDRGGDRGDRGDRGGDRAERGGRGGGNRGDAPPKPRSVQEAERRRTGNNRAKLFISNLPFECTWQQLKDTFQQVGRVSRADIIMDTRRNLSRGMGTVIFETEEDAVRAIEEFDGIPMCGRPMAVRQDRDA